MFTELTKSTHNATMRSALLYTFGLISAWGCNLSSPVFGVLVALPLVTAQEFSLTVLIKRYALQAIYLVSGLMVGEVFVNSGFLVFACSVAILGFAIYRVNTWQQAASMPTMIFYFLFAVVNTSYGVNVEHSLYSLIESMMIQLPVGWLIFRLLPSPKNNKKPFEATPCFTIEDKNFSFLVVVSTLLVFLLVDLTTSIFCTLVVSGCAFSISKKALLSSIKNIVPIQIGGCLIGLGVNVIIFANVGNMIWAAGVLLLLVTFYLFFANNQHLRLLNLDDTNYENNILRAALVPLSLYTSPDGLYISSYFHRSIDMLVTAMIMFSLYLLIRHCRELSPSNSSST